MEEATRSTSTQSLPEPLFVMGTPVVPFASYAHARECIATAIAARRKTFCVAINPEKVYRSLRDRALREILRRADIGICDGVGVALGARLLHGRRLPRCTGVDLFHELLAAAAQTGWRVFLLGAAPESNARAGDELRARFPGLQIVGQQHGYFDDSDAVVQQINASGADLLFVAMGSPRQEFWITKHRDAINAPFCMGVGGTLDVVSGHARRAPDLCRKTGTEFLYRALTEPRRLRRQLALPLFAWNVLKCAVGRRRAAA